MQLSTQARSSIFAAIACVATAIVFYWIGRLQGSEAVLTQFRDVTFASNREELDRLLRLDAMLADGEVESARRSLAGVSWAIYTTLEEEAAGARLAASESMTQSIVAVRERIANYCALPAAQFHADQPVDLCRTSGDPVND
ncbi:MAG: hypothetical protein R3E65_01090 [Steroidobacteraceae bacterium]